MAEEETVAEDVSPGKRKPLLLILIILGGVLVGGAAGIFVVVPMVVGEPAVAASVEESVERPRSSREPTPILHSIDNLVLNPKASGGMRFLMVTVAFEVRDAKTLELMRLREAEIRDALLRTFGSRTVEELAELELREVMREDVRVAIESIVQAGSISKVYLPQFVIQ
jgi:flagellar protein FliL